MKAPPKTIDHPTFGKAELVPSILAVKLATRTASGTIDKLLDKHELKRAKEKGEARKEGRRNPAVPEVNHSETLVWISASAKDVGKLEGDDGVEWVAPVYRAVAAEDSPRSYFAIDPTVIILPQAAAATANDITAIDADASIDRQRTSVMKGFVVLTLPNKNAIEIAQKVKGAILENIPYLSPICCGCGGDGGSQTKTKGQICAPASAPFIPNDTMYPQEWGMQRINAPNAWTLTKGDPNVVVAVLDQGVELGHPDLNLWPISYSTITHTNDGSPVGNHGTACAGIIGGRINSGFGVAGLAGDARVMAIATNFADTQVAEGLFYAADNGARAVSMSFGVYPNWMIWNFAIIEAALQYCIDKNVVLVAASGNEDWNQSRFPGSDPRTLCVGGSNRDDVRKSIGDASVEPWWGACWGPDVDVVAPCLEIPTTDRLGAAGYTPTDYDGFFNGTSSATPHVAALAGLLLSMNSSLTNAEVRQIISETTDKINAGAYVYLPTGGKPFGTWNEQVGYGRINAERALLRACASRGESDETCCVSPCDPPWRPDAQCMVWYEEKFFRLPIGRDNKPTNAVAADASIYIEFRITYEHRMCLLGKQHGPLLYTTTLLPGETVRLYQSERYRRITSETNRFSIQSTFSQFLSLVHQARITGTLDSLNKTITSARASGSSSGGGGLDLGFVSFGSSSSSSVSGSVTNERSLAVHVAAETFEQSIFQASQLTHMERSVVVSTYEDKEIQDITVRVLQNANECRAVTYFVRQVVELWSQSTRVSDVSYRIIAPNFPPFWHSSDDIAWLPAAIQTFIKQILNLLPKVGDVVTRPRPFSLPTDGTVYDPELAHCCSCEPQRAEAIEIRLMKERLEAELAAMEIQRRKLLLQKGELAPFDAAPAPAPIP